MTVGKLLVASALAASEVAGHSWLHCSNYHATINGQDFTDDECSGYIRQWSSVHGATSFATDRGTNYFGSDGAWCQSSFSTPIANMYDSGYPYAHYYVGDTVRMVWPAKNHANYDCFANIPDTSMKLYYNPNPNQTEDGDSLADDWELLFDFQEDNNCEAGEDGCGFQNCPEFCDNTDGAPCFGDVVIKSADFDKDGFYTFMWYWIFNPGSPYTTCFEAFVHTDGSGGGTSAATPSPTTESEDTGDSGEDGSGSSSSSSTDYVIQIPICYDGATYDEDTLTDGANAAFEDDDGVEFSVIEYISVDSDSWNATIQTHTETATTVTGAAFDDSLCDSIDSAFGSDTCYVCDTGAIKVYGQSLSSSGGGGGSDSASAVVILWSIVLFVLVLILVFGACHFLRKKNYITCVDNQIIWQGAMGGTNSGTTTHTRGPPPAPMMTGGQTQTQQIQRVSSNPPRPSGPPPPPRF